jgi:murein L,D-transpeptidase YcbB/YkuD
MGNGRSMSDRTTERMLRSILPALAAVLLVPLPQAAQAQGVASASPQSPLQREIADRAGRDLRAFYAARGNQPLWLNEFGRPSGAASMLMHHLNTAEFDGISPKNLKVSRLAKTVDRARRGDEDDIAKAEVALSAAFAAYVRAMRDADRAQMIYESEALAPVVPTIGSVLETAARADSLEYYIAEMRWMHPLYAPMRDAMEDSCPRHPRDPAGPPCAGRRRKRDAVDVRGRQTGGFDARGRRQAGTADAADGRVHPLRHP